MLIEPRSDSQGKRSMYKKEATWTVRGGIYIEGRHYWIIDVRECRLFNYARVVVYSDSRTNGRLMKAMLNLCESFT